MTADEEPEEQEEPLMAPRERAARPVPMTSRADTEKALALEMARLIGVSPRLLVSPDPEPAATTPSDPPPSGDPAAAADSAAEDDGATG